MRTNLAQWSMVILLIVAAFVGGAFWRESQGSAETTDPCGAGSRSFEILDSFLLRFDDAMTLAINVPRDQVVNQVEELQLIRRQVEEMPVPGCLTPLKSRMVDYIESDRGSISGIRRRRAA